MKQYPSIPKKKPDGPTKFWVFDKLDGSNIRAEWNKKRGFYKFGSRKQLLSGDSGILFKAGRLIDEMAPTFRDIFISNRIDRAVCFFEFHGENSFAGSHQRDDNHRVTLLDVSIHQKGFLSPPDFLNLFSERIDTPALVHFGAVDDELKQEVVNGSLEGMTFEGVVCKAKTKRQQDPLPMFKIKNQAWIDKVKATFKKEQWDHLL